MNTIDEQIKNIDWRNSDQVIKFYEENRLYFENAEIINNKDKVSQMLDFSLHYANSLCDKYYYDKVLDIVQKSRILLSKLGSEHFNYEKSERHIRFLEGIALGQKKKFTTSYPIFKKLVKEDPDHHYYKLWYQHSKIGYYNWIFNLIYGLGVIFLLIDMIFLFILNNPLEYDLALVGIIIMALTMVVQFGFRKYVKK